MMDGDSETDINGYSISHFISFMDEVYYRLFVRQFEALWPAHLVLVALGIAILVFACLGKPRVVAVALAVPLAVCAITFHFQLYSELTLVGKVFGWAFLVQIPLVMLWGFITKSKETLRPSVHLFIGTAIAVFGLIAYPLLTQLEERTWKGAEYFGLAPDPTVCFCVGIFLICARPVWNLLLLPIPILWAFTTWATLNTLEAPYAITLPIIVTITVVAALWKAIFHRVKFQNITQDSK